MFYSNLLLRAHVSLASVIEINQGALYKGRPEKIGIFRPSHPCVRFTHQNFIEYNNRCLDLLGFSKPPSLGKPEVLYGCPLNKLLFLEIYQERRSLVKVFENFCYEKNHESFFFEYLKKNNTVVVLSVNSIFKKLNYNELL